jgi:hypothetical protein
LDDPTLVVIGREPCESSHGPIAVGEFVRLPVVEAIQLHHANKVLLGDWQEQQLRDPIDAGRRRGRYRRRDLRADE